ncbi:MAG: calcium-binding protein [Methylovulum sp.]|nr:calcium-binding protein [Methylovulum sp.]
MATFNVSNYTDLSSALLATNNDDQADIINLTGNISLSGDLPLIAEDLSLTIEGNGFTVSGNHSHRVLFVKSGTVVLDNLTLSEGLAEGGKGGGGGAGMGGALFVYGGSVTVQNSHFVNNQAIGGDGGADVSGGGMGLSGENGSNGSNGENGRNGAAYIFYRDGMYFFSIDNEDGGDGYNGNVGDWGGSGGNGGNGGRGGFGSYANGGRGGNGGDGGNGDFGGGGGLGGLGGGGGSSTGLAEGGGDGGNAGTGGNGGFGGGGGNGCGGGDGGWGYGWHGDGGNGGNGGFGGFGGGGGAGGIAGDKTYHSGHYAGLNGENGIAGFGGGNGNTETGMGGGGAGMGGAVFIRSGSLDFTNVSFQDNRATGGNGNENGLGLGAAIFTLNTTTNSNGNNQGMPLALPTVSFNGSVSFSTNIAGNATGTVPLGAIDPGTDFNNSDLFGNAFSGSIGLMAFNVLTQTQATIFQDTPLIFSQQNGNAISVASVPDHTLSVNLTANHGILTLGSTTHDLKVTGDKTWHIKLKGSLDAINVALANLSFIPKNGFSGLANLTVSSTDETLGNDTDSIAITVAQAILGGNDNDLLSGAWKQANVLDGRFGHDTLRGGQQNDTFHGGAGDDYLQGNSGDDKLHGGSGADTMLGGAGNDAYWLADANDKIVEQFRQGTDQVFSSLSYTLPANVENLTLTTGTENINAIGNSRSNVLIGNEGNNLLMGGFGNDQLFGSDGNDTLIGGSGTNVLIGGAGDDTYQISSTSEKLVEWPMQGNDYLISPVSYALPKNFENLTLTQGAGDLQVLGNELDNILIGNEGNNNLDGGIGADTLQGSSGNDRYWVDHYGDQIIEAVSQGTDQVISSINYTLPDNVENLSLLPGTVSLNGTGNELDNMLIGNDGDNVLLGNLGNDELIGGAGNDTLDGGRGADILAAGLGQNWLTGGKGNDVFQFDSQRLWQSRGTITDFVTGSDVIQFAFEADVFAGVETTIEDYGLFLAVDNLSTAQSASEWFIYDSSTGNLYYNSSDKWSLSLLATLTNHPILQASDVWYTYLI